MKKLDLKKSVNELIDDYPELVEVLNELGFKAITNPIARRTLGRVTTIPGACKKHGKSLDEVMEALAAKGYQIE